MCFSLCDSGGDARTGCIFIVVQSSPEQTQEKDMFRTRLRTRCASLAINDDFTAAAIRNLDEPCDIPSARGDRLANILIAADKKFRPQKYLKNFHPACRIAAGSCVLCGTITEETARAYPQEFIQ